VLVSKRDQSVFTKKKRFALVPLPPMIYSTVSPVVHSSRFSGCDDPALEQFSCQFAEDGLPRLRAVLCQGVRSRFRGWGMVTPPDSRGGRPRHQMICTVSWALRRLVILAA